MKEKKSYSRIIESLGEWNNLQKGQKINLFHHCVEKGINSFFVDYSQPQHFSSSVGTAFSESGLSRDEIQFIAFLGAEPAQADSMVDQVEQLLELLDTDYLDLLIVDLKVSSEEIISAVERLRAQEKLKEIGIFESRMGEHSEFLKDFPAGASFSKLKFSENSLKLLHSAEIYSENITQILFLESYNYPEETQEARNMAAKYNLSFQELIFAWLLHHPAHFHLAVSGNTETAIDKAVKSLNLHFIKEDFNKLPNFL